MVKTAWRHLLQNHPHDSICGCSIDQVHRENAVRFAQSQQIAENLIMQAMQQIAAHQETTAPFPTRDAAAEPLPLVVFNPTQSSNTACVEIEVQLPGSLQAATLLDRNGRALPFQVVKRWRQEIGSMAFSREMLVAAIALSQATEPAQLLAMAQNLIISALGETDEPQAISHVLFIDSTHESSRSGLPSPQNGVAAIEIMIAPATRVQTDEQELLAAGQRMMTLLERADIQTIEIALVDQARQTIEFVAPDLPAHSCTPFWLYPRGADLGDSPTSGTDSPNPVGASAYPRPAACPRPEADPHPNSIENEFYRVTVNERDGTLQVTDRLTNVSFTGLNRFVDGGDIGDLYTYCPPAYDTLVREPIEPPLIELIQQGPVRATLRITSHWALPVSCTGDRRGRSEQLTSCSIVSEVTLIPGLRRIDIHTRIENMARDHRLRVLFPVSYIVEQVAVDRTFEVRMRAPMMPLPEDVTAWAETPVNAFPQKRFVDLSNGDYGLAILNRGLPECEVIQQENGQMAAAITLLRGVEWLSRGDLTTRHGHAGPMIHTPEAQSLGVNIFDYALLPHTGNWYAEDALVLHQAQAFQTPLTTRALVVHQHTGVTLASLVDVEPATLVVSAIKQANKGQGLVIRVYNPLDREIEGKIKPGVAFKQAFMANLQEECLMPLEVQAGTIPVRIRSGGIETIICS
jgi:mannosylglycerate hydrolase